LAIRLARRCRKRVILRTIVTSPVMKSTWMEGIRSADALLLVRSSCNYARTFYPFPSLVVIASLAPVSAEPSTARENISVRKDCL
uniref:Universal stress protein n=1 Tax=Haemonchus placei TaxID=6290 RepID=A0A0N4VU96_HAEPC